MTKACYSFQNLFDVCRKKLCLPLIREILWWSGLFFHLGCLRWIKLVLDHQSCISRTTYKNECSYNFSDNVEVWKWKSILTYKKNYSETVGCLMSLEVYFLHYHLLPWKLGWYKWNNTGDIRFMLYFLLLQFKYWITSCFSKLLISVILVFRTEFRLPATKQKTCNRTVNFTCSRRYLACSNTENNIRNCSGIFIAADYSGGFTRIIN